MESLSFFTREVYVKWIDIYIYIFFSSFPLVNVDQRPIQTKRTYPITIFPGHVVLLTMTKTQWQHPGEYTGVLVETASPFSPLPRSAAACGHPPLGWVSRRAVIHMPYAWEEVPTAAYREVGGRPILYFLRGLSLRSSTRTVAWTLFIVDVI